jgi:16S rRNA (guanine966-N2)-methyltransferase
MRIISGKFKGRRFNPPADNWPTRPTTDYAKEAIFNIINNNFEYDELKVLELFGGTGNHSYEFISRGCPSVTYVEKHGPCVAFVKKMAAALDVEAELRIFQLDVFRFLEMNKEKYDMILADPPFDLPGLDLIPDKVLENGFLNDGAWFILEHGQKNNFKNHPNCFDVRNYGKTYFSFFSNEKKVDE